MKLVSVNIEGNLHTETVSALLRGERPNVFCLQELLAEDVKYYQELFGFSYVFEPWDVFEDISRPTLVGKKNGVAIFARNMIDSGTIYYTDKHALVWADIENNQGEVFKFVTTHLPVTEKGEVSKHQLQVIDALLEELAQWPEFVLCGDTNAPRGKKAWGRIAGKYKDNIPTEYKTSIDQNLHRVKGIQYVVDALFTTPGYVASNVKLVDGVSDHLAVVGEIAKR